MSIVKDFARRLRDVAYRFVNQRLEGRRTADQLGVQLLLDHPAISPRMYYVMSKDYEARDALLASRILDSRSKVLELGASSGFMAIYCRKFIQIQDYAMVEANPRMMSLIDSNFRLNGLDPADTPLIQAVAAADDGHIPFTIHENSWSSSTIDRGGETVQIPSMTLPSIIAGLPFAPDTLISDIEGGELNIPPEHFALFDTLIMETHPKLLPDGAARTGALLTALGALGFKIHERGGDSYVLKRG